MLLVNGKKGYSYYVEHIRLNEDISRRLQALGITKGTKIEVLNCKKSGSIIFSVRGSRLAIGKEIASGLEVKEATV